LANPARVQIKFAETRVISYNLTACAAESDTLITWALSAEENINSFAINTVSDIKGIEVWGPSGNLPARAHPTGLKAPWLPPPPLPLPVASGVAAGPHDGEEPAV
jgi:hypothetical protein